MAHPRTSGAVAVVVAALLATGCSDPAAEPSATSPPAVASEPSTPTATPVPSPTATATTAAAMPTPAPTPTPTPTPAASLPPLAGLALEEVARDVPEPTALGLLPTNDRLVVATRTGRLLRIRPNGTPHPRPLLDLAGVVQTGSIEQGLLGFAFSPHPGDHRVFVYHSLADNDNVLASYEHHPRTGVADPATRTELVVIDKEPDQVRHNGGDVQFGPDGLLWLPVGDAARASVNGQDPATLPGTVLRLDIRPDAVTRGQDYAIPPGNPFADGATLRGSDGGRVAGAPEVYWFGLRNPWRMAIDPTTRFAVIGNVGQETFEEVEVASIDEPGVNFGWAAMEGSQQFYDDPPVTDDVAPALEYLHAGEPQACSITGGEVYRGTAIPQLDGHYFHGDWCLGWIRSAKLRPNGSLGPSRDWSGDLPVGMVSTFGVDADGELLVADWGSGTVSRIVARDG